ncbi:MAG: ARMT1-like domain-containing protein [Campylobacterota bacterium]|nr:ARMT1-like domain-containing protein [Campylobacterota bacterium]
MNIAPECVGCIVGQSERVCDAINANADLKEKITLHVSQASKDFNFAQTPPEVASDVYEDMARLANKEDLYQELKESATQKALGFIPSLHVSVKTSDDKLLSLLKIAVAGNVIDLAAELSFDLDEELDKIFHTDFAIDDVVLLREQLSKAKTLLYIGDNVGEHIFDYLAIETLQNLYPLLHVSYMVRGNPIINDVTMKEAKEAGFDKLCNLVDSGVNTPGFVYNRATLEAQELFDSADVVITKGMGNYECLSPSPRKNLLYLLKVKCNVVANSLGQEVGDIVCKLN